MSMSNTVGATVRPVANDVPVTPMLTNPVFRCRHPPFGFGDPCSWYCQRALTLGFQQLPTDWLNGTAAGNMLVPVRARGPADAVSGTERIVNAATLSTTASVRRWDRRRSPGEPRIRPIQSPAPSRAQGARAISPRVAEVARSPVGS